MVPQLHNREPWLMYAKRFVYILRSVKYRDRRYVGVTADLATRLSGHNNGQNPIHGPLETLGYRRVHRV